MRIINAQLDSIYCWGDDKDKVDRERAAKVEKRRAILAKIGITVDTDDLTRAIPIVVTETQLTDLLVMGEAITANSSFDVAVTPIMRAVEAITEVAAKLERFANSVPDVNNDFKREGGGIYARCWPDAFQPYHATPRRVQRRATGRTGQRLAHRRGLPATGSAPP